MNDEPKIKLRDGWSWQGDIDGSWWARSDDHPRGCVGWSMVRRRLIADDAPPDVMLAVIAANAPEVLREFIAGLTTPERVDVARAQNDIMYERADEPAVPSAPPQGDRTITYGNGLTWPWWVYVIPENDNYNLPDERLRFILGFSDDALVEAFGADWCERDEGWTIQECHAAAQRLHAAIAAPFASREAELLAARSAKPLLDVLRGLTPQEAATLGEMLDDGSMNGALLRQALGNAEHRYYVVSEGWVDSQRIVELAAEIQGTVPSGSDAPSAVAEAAIADVERTAAAYLAAKSNPDVPPRWTERTWLRRRPARRPTDDERVALVEQFIAAWRGSPEAPPAAPVVPPVESQLIGRLASYVERCAAECGHADWAAAYSSLALALRQVERGEVVLGDGPLVDALVEPPVEWTATDERQARADLVRPTQTRKIAEPPVELRDEVETLKADLPVEWVEGRATVGECELMHVTSSDGRHAVLIEHGDLLSRIMHHDEDTAKNLAVVVARAMVSTSVRIRVGEVEAFTHTLRGGPFWSLHTIAADPHSKAVSNDVIELGRLTKAADGGEG